MSGQREAAGEPSGRPVTAQEAIAETLRAHDTYTDYEESRAACECGWEDKGDGYWLAQFAHVAAAVVEAVRALPAEQRAELIGGRVEYASIGSPVERVVTGWRKLPAAPEEPLDWTGVYDDDDLDTTPPAVQGQAHTERSEG